MQGLFHFFQHLSVIGDSLKIIEEFSFDFGECGSNTQENAHEIRGKGNVSEWEVC